MASRGAPVKTLGGKCGKFGQCDGDSSDGEESTATGGGSSATGASASESNRTAHFADTDSSICTFLPICKDRCTHQAHYENMYDAYAEPPHGEFM